MTELRALTVRQPWAWCIARIAEDADAKPVENRGWRPGQRWRGLLAIHAGARVDDDAFWDENVLMAIGRWPVPADFPDSAAWPWQTTGAVVAVATLADVCSAAFRSDRVRCGCGPWAMPHQHHWQLTAVHPLADPVPATGRQGLWIPEPQLAERIMARLP